MNMSGTRRVLGWGRRPVAGTALALALLGLGSACGADWPQWRGPTRSGVAPESPPLADSWPEKGPPRIWESEEIPSGQSGNLSSVVVADGKVFVYVNWHRTEPIATRTVSESVLRKLGWYPQRLPADLEAEVERARLSAKRSGLSKDEIATLIDAWIAEHVPEADQKRLGPVVRDRLTRGRDALSPEALRALETIKDKQFSGEAELVAWFDAKGIGEDARRAILKHVPSSHKVSDDVVLCLSADTGEKLWQTKASGKATGWNFSSTPCIVEGRLYLLVSSGEAVCLRTADGEVLWRTDLPKARNVSSSFLVADGVAVILAGQLTALKAGTGEIEWMQDKIRGSNPSPVLWRGAGGARVICNAGKDVACADLGTGEILWSVPGGGNSTTAVSGDACVVFSSRPDVGLRAYRMTDASAEPLWTFDLTDRGSSPVIGEGYVFAVGGRGHARSLCVALDTGDVAWEHKLRTQEISSPILSDGKVIGVLDNYGSIAMWKASPDAYTELAKVHLPTAACTSPALSDGKLYLRLRQSVVCLDLKRSAPLPEP